MNMWCNLEGPFTALVIGARGGIGNAFVECLLQSSAVDHIFASSRDQVWVSQLSDSQKVTRIYADITDEESILELTQKMNDLPSKLRFVVNCSGLLHTKEIQPERTWRHLDLNTMRQVFDVNTFGVALLIKHILPLIPREGKSLFATLSARLGSITDNQVGGWYSYRASKAAQNMIVKTAAIEARRKWPHLILIALHPGTVKTPLSDPFTPRLPSHHEVFSPQDSCDKLCKVMGNLTSTNTGNHFAWDGSVILG